MSADRPEKKLIMVMHEKDNVGVCLREIPIGQTVRTGDEEVEIISDIPLGHKVALQNFSPGDQVIKYGEVIGRATLGISRGEHVHDHNISDF